MSEIKVDTLTGKTSAGDITVTSEGGAATMQLQQGLAKVWANTSASAITDSLNTSSFTDNSTGNHAVGIFSAMGNTTYGITGFARADGSDTGYAYTLTANIADTKTTSAFQFSSRYQGGGGGSIYDSTENGFNLHGDLA
jgi:hypothetical protein